MSAAYWSGHIEVHRGLPPMEPLRRACGECVVLCGFYLEYAEDLAAQPRDVQEQVAATWDCHLNRRRGCYGVRVVLGQRRLRRAAHARLTS